MKKCSMLLKLIKISFGTILVFIVGVNLYSIVMQIKNKDVMPMPFGIGMAVVLSGSMEPVLSIDDLIIVKSDNNFRVGDVIVYQNNNRLVVHRIVSINDEEIITKGDANDAEDKPILVENVKGKLVYHLEGFGKYVNFVKTPLGIGCVFIITILLFFVTRDKKEENEVEENILLEKKDVLPKDEVLEEEIEIL